MFNYLKYYIKKALVIIGLFHPSLGIKISPEEKAAILLQHKTPDMVTFVETGTESGWMIEKIGNKFEQVYSIEINQNLHRQARERFRDKPYVKLLLGDSGKEIKKILAEIKEPALFWLDAHGSGAITANNTPIISELKEVFTHSIRGHIILIDDARHFDRRTIKMIKKMAQLHDYTFIIKDGIFKLTPRT